MGRPNFTGLEFVCLFFKLKTELPVCLFGTGGVNTEALWPYAELVCPTSKKENASIERAL